MTEAEKERATIVEWLRNHTAIHPTNPGLAILRAATAIQLCDHLKGE